MTACTHEHIVVTYSCPVYVTVNGKNVTRVRVVDESAAPDTSILGECTDCGETVPADVTADAIARAEHAYQWPGWEMGA